MPGRSCGRTMERKGGAHAYVPQGPGPGLPAPPVADPSPVRTVGIHPLRCRGSRLEPGGRLRRRLRPPGVRHRTGRRHRGERRGGVQDHRHAGGGGVGRSSKGWTQMYRSHPALRRLWAVDPGWRRTVADKARFGGGKTNSCACMIGSIESDPRSIGRRSRSTGLRGWPAQVAKRSTSNVMNSTPSTKSCLPSGFGLPQHLKTRDGSGARRDGTTRAATRSASSTPGTIVRIRRGG